MLLLEEIWKTSVFVGSSAVPEKEQRPFEIICTCSDWLVCLSLQALLPLYQYITFALLGLTDKTTPCSVFNQLSDGVAIS